MLRRKFLGVRRDKQTTVEPSPAPEEVESYDQTYQGAHEIDGSIFPEGESELDATEGLPNPLDTLEEVPSAPPESLIEKYPPITYKQGLIGRVEDVPLNSRVEVLSLRTSNDDLGTEFTLTIAQIPDPTPPTTFPDEVDIGTYFQGTYNEGQALYAVVQWGSGAVQYQAIVDIDRGVQLSLSGSFVRVIAVNSYTAVAGGTKNFARIGASVSNLPANTKLAPRYTMSRTLAVGATDSVFVPPFAKAARVTRHPIAEPITIRLTSGVINLGNESLVGGEKGSEFLIPEGTRNIVLSNTGANDQHFSIIFSLNL